MAKRTVVLVFCDMPHDSEVEAHTVSVEVDRVVTEVDLCPDCQVQYLRPMVLVGRSTRRPGRPRKG